jgi:hypothetical protein
VYVPETGPKRSSKSETWTLKGREGLEVHVPFYLQKGNYRRPPECRCLAVSAQAQVDHSIVHTTFRALD